ncbi:helix-turn-helix transcriptional regulator [Kineosporia sp. J2-2]|uniref:Helix-turn-helix transcriptional regulator n=1 Tax=Kineosporia corallincola TaxID=2835133 RepID=A0ABS5TSZ3_9ACTN|nr:helix-turn-helix domain-containing protein [Kineosporia corallincola]MBT0773885.1 helix-turn-helix transcriptional regulator [Kineosporia corallincola]
MNWTGDPGRSSDGRRERAAEVGRKAGEGLAAASELDGDGVDAHGGLDAGDSDGGDSDGAGPAGGDGPAGDRLGGPYRGLDTLRLSDPKAMRVLAHPLRITLLGELRVRGPQSVGMLCEIVDEAPGSVSYHVGKLAEFGFVEEAPELARDRRERWWRAVHAYTSWSPSEDLKDPARHQASGELRRTIARRYAEVFEQYLAAEPAMDPDWVRASTTGDAFLHLTLDQMRELQSEVNDLVERWEARSVANDRTGTQTAVLVYQLFRRPE